MVTNVYTKKAEISQINSPLPLLKEFEKTRTSQT
jgi:hypothetical protein